MQWVRAASLGGAGMTLLRPDGTFETSIVVSETFKAATAGGGGTIDCLVEQCQVIAWRGHTNPTPDSIYASVPLAFGSPAGEKPDDPAPPVDTTPPSTATPPADTTPPPATAVPPSARPSATTMKRQQFKLGTQARKLDVVTVRCGSTACRLQKPKRVAVKIGKRTLWLAVTGPQSVAAGKAATLGVRVSAKVAKQLTGRKARVKFAIQVHSDSGSRTANVSKLLVGASV